MIREVREDEYEQLMSLYCQLHETSVPEYKGDTKELWQRLVANPDYHFIVAEEDGKIVSYLYLHNSAEYDARTASLCVCRECSDRQ